MLKIGEMQSWVIWFTAAFVLAMWWSTADQVADGRMETDPVLVRVGKEYDENSREQIKAINEHSALANMFSVLMKGNLEEMRLRRNAITWAEYQPRLVGTAVLFACFLIWLLAKPAFAKRIDTVLGWFRRR